MTNKIPTFRPHKKLLESLALELLHRLGQNYIYLPESRISDTQKLKYWYDQFGAKFKFQVVKNKKERKNEKI
jgi:hypothetical protein